MPAASVAATTVKPAASVKPAATMKTSATVEAISTMKPSAVKAATAEAFAAEAFTAEAAMKSAIKAPMEATLEATVKTTIKETITVPEAKAPPGSDADEDAAIEPFRAVIGVGSASIRVVVVIAVSAGRRAVINRPPKSDAEGNALGVCIWSRDETNTETNAE
jgi:hypothetical protein